jgi:hypothetical protein
MGYLDLIREHEQNTGEKSGKGPQNVPDPRVGDGYSIFSDTVRDKREKREKSESGLIAEIRAVIAEMPPAAQWDLDETAACILALTEAERAIYYAALIHDWRAWRLAMEQFNDYTTGMDS